MKGLLGKEQPPAKEEFASNALCRCHVRIGMLRSFGKEDAGVTFGAEGIHTEMCICILSVCRSIRIAEQMTLELN